MTRAEDDKEAETRENARARARAKTKAVARTKASEAMAATNEGEVTEATKNDSAEFRDRATAKTDDTEAVEMREHAGTENEQDVRAESKEDDVTVNIYHFQKLGMEQLESNTTAASSFLDTIQVIAAEASDYSRRSLQNRSSFVVTMFGATTFESAIQIQSEHAKTSYAGFIAYLMKMTELRANLAKEFFKPIETAIAKVKTFNP
jgi:Phasin protein